MAFTTRHVYVGELPDYINSEAYQRSAVVPISPHRALSHAHNPRARPSDLALILVFDAQETLVAYIGALPETYCYRGTARRMAWLSCMWVSPDARGQGLASRLLLGMSDHYGREVFVTGFTPESIVLYNRLGFFREYNPPGGVRGYLRPNFADILPVKGGIWAKIKPFLRVVDQCAGVLNGLRLALRAKPTASGEFSAEITAEMAAFIQQHHTNEYLQRSATELNWMLQYPWVLPATPERQRTAARYYFSSVARVFQYRAFVTRSAAGQLQSVVVFCHRDRVLKLVSAHVLPDAIPAVARTLYRYALEHDIATLTVFHTELAAFIQTDAQAPFFHQRPLRNRYLISTNFDLPPDGIFQDGDGDAGFT